MMRPSFQKRKVILDDGGDLCPANRILNTSDRGLLFLDTTTRNTSTIRTKRDCARSTMAILSPEIYLARLEKGVLLSLTPNAEIVRGSLVSSYLVREFGLLHSVLPFLTFPPIPFLLIVSDTTLTSVLETKPKLSIPTPDTRP
jgi:hypothetical protein